MKCYLPVVSAVDNIEVTFGSRQSEFLTIRPIQRPYRESPPDSDDFDWLRCEIEARLGAFRTRFEVHLLASELPPFRDGLRTLLDKLSGEASFSTIEEQVSLRIRGDGRGHVLLSGELRDIAGVGNRLEFTLQLDQTFLGPALRELDEVIQRYPARVRPRR